MEKIITQILQADDRAHHHTAMVVAGVFLSGFMAFWQLLMPHMETHASYSPTWCTDNSGSIDIPLSECNALTDLYVSTDGDNWNDNTNWFNTTSICNTWTGVSCFTNTVYSLNLPNNNLSGVLSSSIGDLISLEFLGLNHNHLYGEIPQELWSIPTLRNVSLYSNNFSGLLSSDFSQATGLRSLFVNSNPDLIIDFDTFVTLNPNIEFLNIDETSFTGDLSNVGLLTGLTYLSINGGFLGDDASAILSGIETLSSLVTLKLKRLDLTGNLPDVWESFPNLQELSLEFNNFSGPLPPSFASLTGLHNLVLSFNNFEGPIPSYFADMPIVNTSNNKSTIDTNCFDIALDDVDLESALDTNFAGWDNQFNCRANVELTGAILGTGLTAGTCSTYEISYENIGPQVAKNLKIGQIFDSQIIVGNATPSYTTGLVGSVYGGDDDSCYIDAAQNGTGPYYAALESIVQTNYGAPSLYTLMVNGLGFTGAQYTTEFAYFMDNGCSFLFSTTDRALCFLLLGMNVDELDPSCGVGGEDGYIWNLGNVTYQATGTIDVELCLPADVTGSVSFTSLVTTASTNENSDGGSQFFNFTVTNNQGNTGNNQDTGDTDTGSTPPPVVQHNHGGERSTVTKDKCLPNPPGDQSSSYYDGDCGKQEHNAAEDMSGSTASGTENTDVDVKHFLPDGSVIQNYIASLAGKLSANTEEISAFLFAKAAVLTGITNFSDLRPYDGITRGEFAKLLVAFVENVLGRKADATRLQMCSRYTDVDSSLGDLQNYIYKACIYSMMGLQNDGTTPLDVFDPYAVLTRKDVVTTIDRMINSTTNDNAVPYYAKHMRALYNAKLITDTDPDKVELRINAFIMFERITEQFDTLFQ